MELRAAEYIAEMEAKGGMFRYKQNKIIGGSIQIQNRKQRQAKPKVEVTPSVDPDGVEGVDVGAESYSGPSYHDPNLGGHEGDGDDYMNDVGTGSLIRGDY